MLRFGVITIMPEMFRSVTEYGVTGRAFKEGLVSIEFWNPRDYTQDVHRTVDDRPYGGGPGMVMMAEPLKLAIDDAKQVLPQAKVIHLSPQGKVLDQAKVASLLEQPEMILLCGRYEGIDERLLQSVVDEELSIGDYVLSGGELPAMVVVDSVVRNLPGVLGNECSAEQDSFASGLLDSPHYTRPETWQGQAVPTELASGNHELIRQWRLKQALGRTWQRRPDLLEHRSLSPDEQCLLDEFKQEQE